MKSVVCCALLLLLAGSAIAQRPRRARASPSPSPAVSPSPAKSPALNETTAGANDTTASDAPAGNDTAPDAATGGNKNIPDKRIKGFYDSPDAAANRIPQLKELSKLVAASPEVSKLLKDKDLVATIFAPNNDAVTAALSYVQSSFPNTTTEQLAEMGIIDALLQYHVTAGNAALTLDRLKDGMKLTMLNKEPTTIVKKAAEAANDTDTGARRLLQADGSWAIRSNTNQTVPIVDTNYQGGKAIIHIIDAVLIPESLVKNFSLTDIPGASNETTAEPGAAGANETAAEPAAGAEGNETSKTGAAAGGTRSGSAPAPSPAPASKSSAATAVATLLSLPALLAVVML